MTRFVWVEFSTVLGRAVDGSLGRPNRAVGFRARFVTSWAGFRGAVSLAAASAVPLTTLSGAPFPDRSLIIFVVVAVILVTVLVQGTTLPAIVRWARMPEDVARCNELQLARSVGAEAALEALPVVAGELGVGQSCWAACKRNTKNMPRWSWPTTTTRWRTTWWSATNWCGGCVLAS